MKSILAVLGMAAAVFGTPAACAPPDPGAGKPAAGAPAAGKAAGDKPVDGKPAAAGQPVAGEVVRPARRPGPETEVIRLRPGQLPEVTLSGDILYRILASEISAQRGGYEPAAQTMLELARSVGDPRLARRALEFYLAGGNLSGALEAARYWSRLSPGDTEASSTELALAASAGQTRGLAGALRARIDAAPDKSVAIAQALTVLGRLQDRRQALQILDDAFSPEVRKLPQARMALSDVAQAVGDSGRAVVEARMALVLKPDSEDAALRLLEYGLNVDADKAIAEARAFAERYSGARRLRLMLASILSDQGRHDEALAELQAMSRRSPEDFDLLFMRAQINYRADRLDEAQSLLQQYVDVQAQRSNASMPGATDANAALADAYTLLARIAERQGRIDDAVMILGRIDDPSVLHPVRMRQATLLARDGRVEDALAMVRSASPQDDEEAALGVLTAAQILRDAGRIDEAVKELEAADADYPDTIGIKYDLAMLYERKNKLADFERLMRDVLELDPEHAHAMNSLGYTLADRGIRLQEAQTLLLRAHELLPDDPYIMDSVGWLYFRMGRNDLAITYLDKAYKLRPEAEIAAHLGEALWRAGRRDEAIQRFREGAKAEAGNATLRATLRRLGVKL